MRVHFAWLKTKALAIEGEEIITSVDSIFAIEILTKTRGSIYDALGQTLGKH